jgi:hypothetical protein
MSIFRETFPQFIINELDRRQDGILSRNFSFVHQLNTRSAWVRMTSGVNVNNSNALASQYVLQGGTLNGNSLRYGLGGNGTSTYDLTSPGGVQHRLGIRPMPGITNVSIQSKGAYGSLQEATVSFIAWDIKQLEDLELLYMRPGYTVLLEFGWDYIKPTVPKYDILNKPEGIVLNDAFKDIYQKIIDSKGNYDALLGYVKNYSWSAREDGGYDCTTSIISLGEVLESLKCNWIPVETTAFGGDGLLGYGVRKGNDITPDYENGIIPGLIKELFYYMDQEVTPPEGKLSYPGTLPDTKFGSTYHLYMSKRKDDLSKLNRGGLSKPLGDKTGTSYAEGYITLGSFCELLNNYVLLTDGKEPESNPLSQITTYETDTAGNIDTTAPLKCIASPLSISTNYGICFVRNDNWQYLGTQEVKAETEEDKELTQEATIVVSNDVKTAIQNQRLFSIGQSRISPKIDLAGSGNVVNYVNGNLQEDLQNIAEVLSTAIVKTNIIKNSNDNLIPEFIFIDGNRFTSRLSKDSRYSVVSFFDYFSLKTIKTSAGGGGGASYTVTATKEEQINQFYNDLFGKATNKDIYNNGKLWTSDSLKAEIDRIFSNVSISKILQDQLTRQVSVITTAISEAATNVPGLTSETLQFLVPNSSANNKSLGYIGNIYVNMDFLYSQAISKNVASNDPQNKNTIFIREYIQGILREVQNSLGAINSFDLQVDNRNAIGRIIDINYTGDPNENLFTLQIHNLNSVVRKYDFQSKIFPEMGSIIAISAQDATGIGKLGYDNATLIAWNDGIKDRLIPKKDFTKQISVGNNDSPVSFLFPFLTKLYEYFKALDGRGTDNKNLAYGGLDFAYRDFLANLSRFDPQNNFKAIIPTELSVTLDGIGGIVIGNLFKINQDIVPRGYRAVKGRDVAYIVTKLGHSIQNNDWTTTLSAYPVIIETRPSSEIWKKWNAELYSGETTIIKGADGKPIVQLPALDSNISKKSNIPVVKYLQGLRYKNGEIPDNLLQKLNIPDDPESNSLHRLFPSAATQWEKLVKAARKEGFTVGKFNISYESGAAYRPLSQQQSGFGRAEDGKSIHGWGAAVDIQQLYTEAYEALPKPGYKPPAGAANNAFVRGSSALYQWLNKNAANYGWINPPLLKDGSGQDECWHWEYWGPVNPADTLYGGRIGAVEATTTPKGSDVPFIVAAIKDATDGINISDTALIEALSRIPDLATFKSVNNQINIQGLLNEELGLYSRDTINTIQSNLSKIGVKLTTVQKTNAFGIASLDIKLTF